MKMLVYNSLTVAIADKTTTCYKYRLKLPINYDKGSDVNLATHKQNMITDVTSF